MQSVFNMASRLLSEDCHEPEVIEEAVKKVVKFSFNSNNEFYNEELATEALARKLYDITYDSYTKSTGKAWSPSQFKARIQNWVFFIGYDSSGEPSSYIAYRPQRRGDMAKLVAVSGTSIDSLRIFKDHISTDPMPLWGLVSKEIAVAINKLNLPMKSLVINEPKGMLDKAKALLVRKTLKFFLSKILKSIPKTSFTGKINIQDDGEYVSDDGGISINMDISGQQETITKYFICNKPYMDLVADKFGVPDLIKDILI